MEASISVYAVPVSVNELIEQSVLVVYGRVTHTKTVVIDPVNSSGNKNEFVVCTDYYLEPISVLRGTPVNKKRGTCSYVWGRIQRIRLYY